MINHLVHFFDAVKPFQRQHEKPNKKITESLLQQSANLINSVLTDNTDSIAKIFFQGDNRLHFDLSLNANDLHGQATSE